MTAKRPTSASSPAESDNPEQLPDADRDSRAALDAAPVGVLVHRDLRALYLNQAWARLHGSGVDEVMALPGIAVLLDGENRDAALAIYRGEVRQGGYLASRRGDVAVWLECSTRRIRWQGAPAVMVVMAGGAGPCGDGHESGIERRHEQEQIHKHLLAQSEDRISIVGRDFRYLYSNRRNLEFYGLSLEQLVGRHVADLIGKQRFEERARDKLQRCFAGEEIRYSYPLVLQDGRERFLDVCMTPYRDRSGQVAGACVSMRDMSELHGARLASQRSEALLRSVLDHAPAAIFFKDMDGRFQLVNERFVDVYGHPREAVIGRHANELFDGEGRERSSRSDQQVLLTRQTVEFTFSHAASAGEPRHRAVVKFPVFDSEQALMGIGGVELDVTERERLARELERQAMHDPLTDLPNRRAFEDCLQRFVVRVNRESESGAVAYLDLDRFKIVNDSQGHAAGDALLRQLSATLLAGVGERALLARLGGDEFALLMESCTIDTAWAVCEDVCELVQSFRFGWDGQSYSLGCSVGLVPLVAPCSTPGEIMVAADNACYRAKDEGRDRIHMLNFEDADEAAHNSQARWLAFIESALANGRLRLFRQPIEGLGAMRDSLERFELLLRLEDESGGLHDPARYLAVAERYGLSGRIDRFTVSTALGWLSGRLASPGSPIALCSINLSAYSITDSTFLQYVLDELQRSGVPGRVLCFEITETTAVSNLAEARSFMRVLGAKGCRFALDDFGTGVASFGYLKALPADIIKIDGMFVRDVLDDAIDLELVRSINSIAHAMGKQTVAEFVENDGIRRCMSDLGVDFVQGYGVGYPEPL